MGVNKQGGDPLAIYVCQIRLHTLNFYNVIYQSYFNKMGKITQFQGITLKKPSRSQADCACTGRDRVSGKNGVTLYQMELESPCPIFFTFKIKLQCIWKQLG